MSTLRQALGLEQGGVVSLVGAGGKTTIMFRLAGEFREADQSVLTTTTTKIMMPEKKQCRHVILATSPRSVIEKAEKPLKENLHLSAASRRVAGHREKLSGFSPDDIDEIKTSGCFRWIVVEADGAARKPLKAPAVHEPVIPSLSDCVIGVVGLKALGRPLEPEWVFRHSLFASITGIMPGKPITEAAVVTIVGHPSGIMKTCPPRARKIIFLNAAGIRKGIAAGRRIAETVIHDRDKTGIERVVIGRPRETPAVIDCFSADR